MSYIDNQNGICAVEHISTKACVGDVIEVILVSENSTKLSAYPQRLNLCQYHHQLELMVWGVKKFFAVYNLLNTNDRKDPSENRWQDVPELLPDDSRLSFSLPDELEFWLNRLAGDFSDGSSHSRPEFAYLKEVPIDLGEVRLTDKQLMAVCMVFYGGVKKKRAAQAMNITSQALSDHVNAALKKIGNSLAST